METKIIQNDFINSEGHQDLTLTVVGIVGKHRVRVYIRRNHYTFQSYAKTEVWTKQVGGLDAGWSEILTISGERLAHLKTESRYMKGEELEDARNDFRMVAQEMVRDSLVVLGILPDNADSAAEELIWGAVPVFEF